MPQSAAAASVPASPSFSPFVESRDWERDILGVARWAAGIPGCRGSAAAAVEPEAMRQFACRFLRMCPGLSRQIIGDLLGENNERCLRVLECFTASFDFRGVPPCLHSRVRTVGLAMRALGGALQHQNQCSAAEKDEAPGQHVLRLTAIRRIVI